MKILFLLQEFPYPPANGFSWKVFSLLKGISRRHECHLLSFANSLPESSKEAFLLECPTVKVLGIFQPRTTSVLTHLRGLFEVGLPSAGIYSVPEFRQAVRQALATTSYDVVHIDMINLVQYAALMDRRSTILSVNDAVSLFHSSLANEMPSFGGRLNRKLASKIIARYERKAYCGRVVQLVSKADAEHLKKICSGARFEAVPLVVDSRYFLERKSRAGSNCQTVVIPANFRGAGTCHSVLEFLETAQRLGKSRQKSAVVYKLIGPNATPSFIRALSGFDDLEYLGWVEDYVGALAASDLVVVPERGGGGMKTRVLQAMALGQAVLLTETVASAIGVKDGEHCLVCRTTQEFAEAALWALDRDSARDRLGQAARAFVQSRHNSEIVMEQWEALYASVASNAKKALFIDRPDSKLVHPHSG